MSELITDELNVKQVEIAQNEEDLVNPEDRLSVFKRLHLMPRKILDYITKNIVSVFDVRTESIHTAVRNLSGGNQQKVLLGREFSKFPRLIVASEHEAPD